MYATYLTVQGQAKPLQITLTETSICDLQVPQVNPQVIRREEVFSIAIWVYRIHVIRVSIRKYPSEASGDGGSGHRCLRECKCLFVPCSHTISIYVRLHVRNSLDFLLLDLPQLHSFIYHRRVVKFVRAVEAT